MQHDWFMYHLRSTYKNRLDFPFKTNLYTSYVCHSKQSKKQIMQDTKWPV